MPKTSDPLFSSFNFLETLFKNAVQNCALIMDEEGVITAINPAFTNCFGYEQKDILGKKSFILFTEEDQKKGLPQKELRAVLSKGQGSDNNYLVSKDGTVTWVSGESMLAKNDDGKICILKLVQNIHQQKTYEAQLEGLNEFNENLLSSIEDAVIVLDETMNIVKANTAFDKLFNHDAEGIVKMNFADLIKPFDEIGNLKMNIEKAISHQKMFANVPLEIKTNLTDKKIFDVSCNLMQHLGNQKNMILVMHDITTQKLAEREREDIIGFVAHELRNPLANLVLCNEIIGEAIKDNETDEVNDLLLRSKNNIMRLNKMIGELYDATKVSSGNLKLEISTFNFKEMIKEAIETIVALQPAYKILVKGDTDIDARGDRYRLIQVITNYLSNGIKYSNGKTEVIITVKHDKENITVSVKDEGLGISKINFHIFLNGFSEQKKLKILKE